MDLCWMTVVILMMYPASDIKNWTQKALQGKKKRGWEHQQDEGDYNINKRLQTLQEWGLNGHTSECDRVDPNILLTDLCARECVSARAHARVSPQRQSEAWLIRERRKSSPPSTAPPGETGNALTKKLVQFIRANEEVVPPPAASVAGRPRRRQLSEADLWQRRAGVATTRSGVHEPVWDRTSCYFPPACGPRASPASVPTSPVGSNSGDPRFLLYEVDFF